MDSAFSEYWEAGLPGGRKDQLASLETSPVLHQGRVALSLLSISFHVYPRDPCVCSLEGESIQGPDEPLSVEALRGCGGTWSFILSEGKPLEDVMGLPL